MVRAPGRVNLIGEHVDYCGYPVLPMAIEQDTWIALSTDDHALANKVEDKGRTDTLSLANHQTQQWTPKVIQAADKHVQIDTGKHHWTNYVLAGYKVRQDKGNEVRWVVVVGCCRFEGEKIQ